MPFLPISYVLATSMFANKSIRIYNMRIMRGNMKNYLEFQNIIRTFAPKKSVLWKLSKVRKNTELSSFLNRYLFKYIIR